MLDAENATTTVERSRRQHNLVKLRAVVLREARRHGGQAVLVVTQKRIQEQLERLGPWPTYIDLAHHNAITGRDIWRHVRQIVIVGRTLPPPTGVETLAEALNGRAVNRLNENYEQVDGVLDLGDDTGVCVSTVRHPDPLVERIRWQIAEGEIVQIIGRGRGVNRDAERPLDVLILCRLPLPITIDKAACADDLSPSPADLMLAVGGVALDNAADAARAYPQLWPSKEAARQAIYRARFVTNPNKEFLIGKCHALRSGSYQKAGRGQLASTFQYDPELQPDPRGFLAARLGQLSAFSIETEKETPDASSGARNQRLDMGDGLSGYCPVLMFPLVNGAAVIRAAWRVRRPDDTATTFLH